MKKTQQHSNNHYISFTFQFYFRSKEHRNKAAILYRQPDSSSKDTGGYC